MSNDNTLLIGAAVLGFLVLRRNAAAPRSQAQYGRYGGVSSMPGSVGGGLQQIATGAVAGFFQQLARSPSNNTSGTVARMPSSWDPIQRGGIAQEAVPSYGDFGPLTGYQYEYE